MNFFRIPTLQVDSIRHIGRHQATNAIVDVLTGYYGSAPYQHENECSFPVFSPFSIQSIIQTDETVSFLRHGQIPPISVCAPSGAVCVPVCEISGDQWKCFLLQRYFGNQSQISSEGWQTDTLMLFIIFHPYHPLHHHAPVC